MECQDKSSEDVQKGYKDPIAVKIKEECQDEFAEEIKTSTGDAEVIKVIIILLISYAE